MTGMVPTRSSLAPCSPPSRPLRAAFGGGLRPVLTAAVRGATLSAGRDEETVPSVEQRNCTRYRTFLQNFPDTTLPLFYRPLWRQERADSLLSPKTSLIARLNSLIKQNKSLFGCVGNWLVNL